MGKSLFRCFLLIAVCCFRKGIFVENNPGNSLILKVISVKMNSTVMKKKRALLISFEGIEGTGKSTQCRLLVNYLRKNGLKTAFFREPGSSLTGEGIRNILLHSKGKLTCFCETMLFIAARGQLIEEKIRPLLFKKDVIILDRFIDATVAYQGYGAGVDRKLIKELNRAAIGELVPDLTILLDVPVKTGIVRCRRTDRFEKRKLAYHQKVREGYLRIRRGNPGRIKLVSGEDKIKDVQEKVREMVEKFLLSRKGRKRRST